jgi:hypothetical protein
MKFKFSFSILCFLVLLGDFGLDLVGEMSPGFISYGIGIEF